MFLLAIETSCDETSAAVIRDGMVLSNVVSSQTKLHSDYGGVVPELATREHLRNWSPVVREALRVAEVRPGDLSTIAATQGPGLPNALMIGFKAAQSMAYALSIPFHGVHHHEGHLYSAWITGAPPRLDPAAIRPNVTLIVSGGHTLLVEVQGLLQHRVLGTTLDDAAGECFDKVGKLLGLPYPAGPVMDRMAGTGNSKAYDFPRPMLRDPGHDFSFAGLKTSVRYFLQKHPQSLGSRKGVGDVCASVQAAIVDVLVAKTVRAAKHCGVGTVAASGGVTCNSLLRKMLRQACETSGLELRLASPVFCTDNAAMIGITAWIRAMAGEPGTEVSAEIKPRWDLQEVSQALPKERIS